jgi:Na+/melibiose symporter-like transporter
MISYGLAPFLSNLTAASYNILLFYYYEVELGLSIVLVGLSYVIYAIWNMVNDPLTGFLTDKPMRWSKKYGLRTPWIIVSGLLMILSYYFLFAVPDVGDVKSDPWPLFWYMVIITCLFDTFFSIFQCHFLGGFGNIFRTEEQRRTGSMTFGLVAIFSAMFIRIFIIAQVIVYGDPTSFVRAALLTMILGIVCLALLLPGVHENEFVKQRYLQIYEFLETQKLPYFKLLKITFKQKNYMTFLIAYTMFIVAQNLNLASELFMLREVLGFGVEVLAITAVAVLITIVPSIILWSHLAKKIGHSTVFTINLMLLVIGYGMALFVSTLLHIIIQYAFMGFTMGAYVSVLFSLTADTNDEVVNAAGRHVEATMIGIRNFFFRVAYLTTGIIIAGVHIATGYVPGAETQTDLAYFGIRFHTGGFPALFCLIGAIIMYKFYDLKGEKREQLMASLRKQGL